MVWPVTGEWSADPFEDLRGLHQEVDRLFRGFPREGGTFPAVNIYGNDHELVLTAEIPGLDPKDIDIQVQGDHVTVKGERKAEEVTGDVTVLRNERERGPFARTFRLPFDIQSDKVGATFHQGVLRVTLPRAEATKPKQIDVSVA